MSEPIESVRVSCAWDELVAKVEPRVCGVVECGRPLRVVGFRVRRNRDCPSGLESLFVELVCPTSAHGRVEPIA